MISKHIRFTKEQDKALEKLSVLTGAPVTELVRRAVEEYSESKRARNHRGNDPQLRSV